MGPGDHSCGAGRQALGVGILGMVDFFIPLGAIRCENELLAGQDIPSNVIHWTAKPHSRQVRMRTGRLRVAFIPPGSDRRLWFPRLCSAALCRSRCRHQNQ